MAPFARSFETQALANWDREHRHSAVRALFDRWALPGQAAHGEAGLRLGVRDGYLNFYIKGQSVAKLSCGRSGPQVSVHEAYAGDAPAGQKYRTFDASSLAQPETAALIPRWIENALTYASAEKRFVDDLVATNAGVVDLEMGLPASDQPGSAKVAPRMDLVVAEVVDGTAAIVFWEAKCANNGELRSSRDFTRLDGGGFTGPKVVEQLSKYVRWMEEQGRTGQVQTAYRKTASVMLDLYRTFATAEGDDPPCVAIWKTLADGPDATITLPPGLVIGNYWPEGSTEGIASGRMGQCARSFARNGHRAKLDREGLRVHEVESDGDLTILPRLALAAAA